MNLWDWVDKGVARIVTAGIFLGTSAAALRGLREKEAPRAFLARIISGALTAGIFSYVFREWEMPSFIWGALIFASGYSSAEMAAVLSKFGKKKVEEKIDANTKDEDKHHE